MVHTRARRYDLILDNAGNHSVLEYRHALTPRGTLLPNSGAGGRWLDGLPRAAGAFALSPFVRQRLRPFVPAGKGEDLVVLTELIEAGKVTPVIDRTYPLSETAEALAYYGLQSLLNSVLTAQPAPRAHNSPRTARANPTAAPVPAGCFALPPAHCE